MQGWTQSQQTCQHFPLLSILMYLFLVSSLSENWCFFCISCILCFLVLWKQTLAFYHEIMYIFITWVKLTQCEVHVLIKPRPVTWLCAEAPDNLYLICNPIKWKFQQTKETHKRVKSILKKTVFYIFNTWIKLFNKCTNTFMHNMLILTSNLSLTHKNTCANVFFWFNVSEDTHIGCFMICWHTLQ